MFITKSSAQSNRPLQARSMIKRALVLTAFWAAVSLPVHAQDYSFTTLSGVSGSTGSTNGSGNANGKPLFNSPGGVTVDSSGNIFVADTTNSTIRKITPAGVVTTFAGIAGLVGNVDGTGTAARFALPEGQAIDSNNNIYVADYGSHTIRKITPAGVVTTLAGSPGVTGGIDGTGAAARFNGPSSVAVDTAGIVYVADTNNNLIRKITPAGVVTTLAGPSTLLFGTTDGTGSAARFHNPRGVAVSSSGTVYVADTENNTIRMITAAGVVTTLAGNFNTAGSADGTGTAALFNFPNSLAVDASGNLYVADEGNNTIRKITTAGVVTTLAGNAGNAGYVDATGTLAKFNRPTGVAVDSGGNVYVTDDANNLIRKISSTGVVTPLAGVPGTAGSADGTGYTTVAPSTFNRPSSTATNSTTGDIYVADTNNHVIRKITTAGVTSTIAGSALQSGSTNATGNAARFFSPSGVALDSSGNIYVADTGNHIIRKITTAGVVTTLAGTAGISGNTNATGAAASFNLPSSVAVDAAGNNVYVADYNNHTIRKIDSSGNVSTFAGSGTAGSANGTGTAANFNYPRSLAIDASFLYVADTGNHTIRKISLGGAVVTTVAGTAGASGNANGTGAAARFNGPSGIAVDPSGTIFVADTNNQTIRAISPAAVVTTLAGSPGLSGNADGIGNAVRFDQPNGLSVYGGILYVADYRNNTIRRGVLASSGPGPTPPPIGGTTPTGNGQILRPEGVTTDSNGFIYVADTANNSIKRIASDGTVTVFAGKNGTAGSVDGTGTAAMFNRPTALATDGANNIFVADTGNAVIRKITTAGVVTTIAGSPGNRGNQDGTGTSAYFQAPAGIVIDSAANLYVTDSVAATLRKISPTGVVTTYAGKAMTTGDTDSAVPTDARFNNPTGLAIDGSDNLYIADTNNSTIRKINTFDITTYEADTVTVKSVKPAGTVITLAGSAGISGSYDGIGNYALFSSPTGLSASSLGTVYVADTGNSLIRAISPTGSVFTIAGIAGIAEYRDGASSTALFNHPAGIALGSNNVVIADTGNSSIRLFSGSVVSGVTLKAPTTTTPSTPSTPSSPSSGGGAFDVWFASGILAIFLLSRRRRA